MLELAITLAVLAVLGALALPSLGNRLQRQRLQHAAQTLAGDVAEARFEAARRGRALFVQSSAGPDWCWAIAAVPDCPCGQPQACQIHNVRAADHPGVRMPGALGVRLDADGAATLQAAATFESAQGERLRVEVSVLGRPRICASAGTWPRLPAC